jgi:hypothetical protein
MKTEVAAIPVPVLGMKVGGTSQVFTANNGLSGTSCFIVDTTNPTLPLNQWSDKIHMEIDGEDAKNNCRLFLQVIQKIN